MTAPATIETKKNIPSDLPPKAPSHLDESIGLNKNRISNHQSTFTLTY